MKVHKSLEELLEDFILYYKKEKYSWDQDLTDADIAEAYLSSNSLASSEPKPLAKNKDCADPLQEVADIKLSEISKHLIAVKKRSDDCKG